MWTMSTVLLHLLGGSALRFVRHVHKHRQRPNLQMVAPQFRATQLASTVYCMQFCWASTPFHEANLMETA